MDRHVPTGEDSFSPVNGNSLHLKVECCGHFNIFDPAMLISVLTSAVCRASKRSLIVWCTVRWSSTLFWRKAPGQGA
jgi:hypothetical protein